MTGDTETRRTIVSCAVTGNITTREQHPRLPVTPAEIAQAALEAAEAGAAIAHIHVRHPETGRPSMEIAHYREVYERIRAKNAELIVNLSTGEGGRFVPGEAEPRIAAEGTTLTTPQARVAHVVALRPDICSLDFNTMFSGRSVVINTPRNLSIMAGLIRGAGVKPELEVFDSGDIHLANDFLAEGKLDRPPFFQLVTGVKYGAAATPETLLYLRSLLPADAAWSAFGIGRFEFPMLAQSFLLGGQVRVGLEDNVYLERGVLARDNAQLVEKAVGIVRLLGGEVATAAEARARLGLGPGREPG
ncbi:Uncharacterized conserved protein, DUF849 family [Tistlia consotensis]|uniref:Uncharacterized conserved protein, DUF849 family n=1 Tax=Tistlia consotensis USBA 355 TaxID=560819 RepID=A0A1Y6C154_9PROT|nr:3-keto-5-aminohexanoate cleavage protein [Tistlia consotensis]SMF38845.1 Uncharacterized conserved protein, DUF849 family [Tistlia consotensis USBA 355]SNR36795.1 Uncharacterized conserved protein, DUF849 family [Tistlia consotensis]